MIPVSTAGGVRALDAAVIERLGLPGRALMEVAGAGCAEVIHSRWPEAPITVLCGPGNNGGDGYVIARRLQDQGHSVRLHSACAPASPDALANAESCARLQIPMVALPFTLRPGEVLVDALLGTGQRQAPKGAVANAVTFLNKAIGHPRVAIDTPTGVDADRGQVLGEAVTATLTLTLGEHKAGLFCEPGATLAGEVRLIDIGLGQGRALDPSLRPAAWLLEDSDTAPWWPPRGPGIAKWDRGYVGIRAGGGAGVLSAHAALRAGAGLVTLFVPREDWSGLHGLWPEVVLAEPDRIGVRRQDAIVLGPGLGLDPVTREEVRRLWRELAIPLVVDADALTHLADATDRGCGGPRVITPHVAEAARLLATDRAAVEADRFAALQSLRRFGVPVLKGRFTLIGATLEPPPPGEDDAPWINQTGSHRLATAGSGDVLAGVIAALLAAGLPPRHAAALGVTLHGQAGERMSPGDTASDLVRLIRPA